MKTKRVAGAACVLACTLAGCTPGRVLDQFSDPEPHSVTLACGEAYKIYEKERPRRLVIASSVKQEFTRDTCEGFEKLDKHERFAKIAKDHLAGTGREKCKVVSADPLSLSEYAVLFRCPKPGEADEKEQSKKTKRL